MFLSKLKQTMHNYFAKFVGEDLLQNQYLSLD